MLNFPSREGILSPVQCQILRDDYVLYAQTKLSLCYTAPADRALVVLLEPAHGCFLK
jgi:hypothetical protein